MTGQGKHRPVVQRPEGEIIITTITTREGDLHFRAKVRDWAESEYKSINLAKIILRDQIADNFHIFK